MYLKKLDGPRAVKLPDGSRMTLADLPPTNTRRWVASRKALVVRAVKYGLLLEEEALSRYSLSKEELASWTNAFDQYGANALKATSVQKFR